MREELVSEYNVHFLPEFKDGTRKSVVTRYIRIRLHFRGCATRIPAPVEPAWQNRNTRTTMTRCFYLWFDKVEIRLGFIWFMQCIYYSDISDFHI